MREAERRLCAGMGRLSFAAREVCGARADRRTQSVMTGRPLLAIAAGAIVAWTIGCGGGTASAPTPTPTSPTTPPTSAGSVTDISGAWNGTGSDPQGPERMTWTLTQ